MLWRTEVTTVGGKDVHWECVLFWVAFIPVSCQLSRRGYSADERKVPQRSPADTLTGRKFIVSLRGGLLGPRLG